MKYKTFRAVAAGGAVVLGGGALFLVGRSLGNDPPAVVATPVESRALAAAPEPVPTPEPVPVAAPAPGGLRPMDEEILAAAKKGISGDKQKDAVPGRAWKVNLYRDAGKPGVNRLKVDLDRDDKWDEKWSFVDDGTIERQVSSVDDDRTYDQTYTLRDGRWQRPGESAPAPASAPPATAIADKPVANAGALRPMDQEILRVAASAADSEKIKDAFPAQAYKVNFYRDAGFTSWNRAKVDLDRDEKADEKWNFEGSGAELKVKRQVAPADDENYSLEYRLQGGAWVEKK